MIRKYWLLLTALFLTVFFLSVFAVDERSYARLAERSLSQHARSAGVLLNFENSALHWLGLSSSELGITIPRSAIAFELQDALIDLDPSSLLSSQPKVELSAKLYSGDLSTALELLPQDSFRSSLSLQNANMSEYPILAGLGFSEGKLSLNIPTLTVERGVLQQMDLKLKILKASKPASTMLAARFTGLPFDFSIPSIESIEMLASCQHERNSLKCPEINFDSSLGKTSGFITLILDASGKIRAIDLNLEVRLSAEGSAQLGSYLPLISAGVLKRKTQAFRVQAKDSWPTTKFNYQSL